MLSELSVKDSITWVDLNEPVAEELAEFARTVNLLPVDAEFIVQDHQRPEITVRRDYIVTLVYVPVLDKQTRLISNVPLYLVSTPTHLWTIHFQPLILLDRIFEDYSSVPDKFKEYSSDGSMELTMHLISKMYGSIFRKLDHLEKTIDRAEDSIFHGNERKMMKEISELMRDVMSFRKIIRPQINLYNKLPDHALFTTDMHDQWARLHGQINKLWEILEGLYENTKELASTNNTMLQHKENELLRLLTNYTLILFPALAVAQAMDPYGANSSFLKHLIFWGVLIFLFLGLVLIRRWFHKKRVF